ncbi:MAG: type II secretion system F family protein [Cyanobacteria bacterium REEB67]|nr:type II secretion system F family protein [Cyanobacteria bacterium REEB67]
MQAALLFEYPEVIGASLLAALLVIIGMRQNPERENSTWHLPALLAEPAKSVLVILPAKYLRWLDQALMRADFRSNQSFGDFAGAKVYLALSAMLLLFFFPPYVAAAVALVLFCLPDLYLKLRLASRQEEIRRALPQAIDLMVLCVDAGLGLDATLQRIASENSEIASALNDEFVILGREILLGVDREKAYTDLYIRTGVEELKSFGSALNQATKLGLSIAKILRAQSEFLRKRQSQQAEEKAMRMPIYMAFPLWFFVMPALMLLVLGPSLIRFYQTLHP